jgi:hypothetical protein
MRVRSTHKGVAASGLGISAQGVPEEGAGLLCSHTHFSQSCPQIGEVT